MRESEEEGEREEGREREEADAKVAKRRRRFGRAPILPEKVCSKMAHPGQIFHNKRGRDQGRDKGERGGGWFTHLTLI